jgi:hypothetical protein
MRPIALVAALTLAACAAPPGPGRLPTDLGGFPLPVTNAVETIPPQHPYPLPARDPPARPQSQIERMSTADLVRWALPEHAAETIRAEPVRIWMPEIRLVWFFERPQSPGQPGVCQVFARGVSFRIPNEAGLTYQQHLNPPLEPYQDTEMYRYKVIDPATPETCGGAIPDSRWFEAPSALAVFRAMTLVKAALAEPARVTVTCQDDTPCNGPAVLRTLTPNLIEYIEGEPCPAGVAGQCWRILYDSPTAPASSHQYQVSASPGRIDIRHVMKPPM